MKTKQLGNLRKYLPVVVMGLLLFSALAFMLINVTSLLDKANAQTISLVSLLYKVPPGLAVLVVIFLCILPIVRGADEDRGVYRGKIRALKFIEDFIFPWIQVLEFAVVFLIYFLLGFTVNDEVFGLVVMVNMLVSFVVAFRTHRYLAKKIKERFFST